MTLSKNKLRQSLIKKRKILSTEQVDLAANALCHTLHSKAALKKVLSNAKTVLSYCAFNNEISPYLLTQQLSAEVYLPKITGYSNSKMEFFSSQEDQVINKYGITEPKGNSTPMPINEFDVLLIPLVGFDDQGNRLGMGAGFYDRAIGTSCKLTKMPPPLLLGLAYDFQQIKTLIPEVWDIPLDVILTDQKIVDPKNQLTM